MMAQPPTVFLSYSHRDETWKDRLAGHLHIFEQEGVLDIWEQDKIRPGSDRYQEIETAINQASLAVLLVSADFFNSPTRDVELRNLLSRWRSGEIRLFPVIVRPCPYTHVEWLSKIQVRPRDGALISKSDHEIEEILSSIAEEIVEIIKNDSSEPLPPDISAGLPVLPISEEEIYLPIFNVSGGKELFAAGGVTDLNFLALDDYERSSDPRTPEAIVIDVTKRRSAGQADYILEIDEGVEPRDDLNKGDWLLVRDESDPSQLSGSTVAILESEHFESRVGRKIFFQAEDHYFLKSRPLDIESVLVICYRTGPLAALDYYYEKIGPVNKKFAYQVRVSGEVIDHIRERSIENIAKAFIRQVPVVGDIGIGSGIITAEDIEEYTYHIDKYARRDADFGVRMRDDSMTGDDIFPGDIVFIRQQPTVKVGEIAAVMIFTPKMESLAVLRRFYVVHEQRNEVAHWLLESSNPSSEHLVVMPDGADVKAIKQLYVKQVDAGNIIPPQFYSDAEITIAGKFVGYKKQN